MKNLFQGIDFKNKRVLDIGGGFGLYSFYAACSGAKEVVSLEPEAQGSSGGVMELFNKLNKIFSLNNITIQPVTIQDFDPNGESYDVILLYNSINHLNEDACINLLTDPTSKAVYQSIFTKIYSISSIGAKLIICDCGRNNFFDFINMRNPFVPSIEWHKHQEPKEWVKLLVKAGFKNPKIEWTAFNVLYKFGRVILGNKFAAYFLKSFFTIRIEKPNK